MKTAISLPDELYAQAEETAERLHMSRSELYAKALAQFIMTQQRLTLTADINAFIQEHGQDKDPVWDAAARRTIRALEW